MKKPCSIISPRLVFENALQPIAVPLYKDDKRLLLASAGFLQRSLLMDVFLQIWESTALQHLWDARLSQSPCLDMLRTSDLMLILSGLLVCDSPALHKQISFLMLLITITISIIITNLSVKKIYLLLDLHICSLKECLLSFQERVIYLSREWYGIVCINFGLNPSVNNATDFPCCVLFCRFFLQSAIWGRIWW